MLASPGFAEPSDGRNDRLRFTIEVPIDHDRPRQGRFPLACEWGAPPRAGLATVVLVADAQQFYVRPGGAARIQGELFGQGCNVLAVVGRSRASALEPIVCAVDGTDWNAARRLLNWRQWGLDLSVVIDWLSQEHDVIGLYGRSGGANLIHQLLTLRPELRVRAYLQAAVNHDLDVHFGFSPDPFWDEFAAQDPATAHALLDFALRHPDQRRDLVLILQRQHFFVSRADLSSARLTAVRAFLNADELRVADFKARYQISAIDALRGTLEGIGSMVRIAEFAASHPDPRDRPDRLDPDVEALFHHAGPALGHAAAPADWSRLRTQASNVLQVAGRYDATCDYRTQIKLNEMTRRSRLLLLDDDHVFRRWSESGTQPSLIQAFFQDGWNSHAFRNALAAVNELVWRDPGRD